MQKEYEAKSLITENDTNKLRTSSELRLIESFTQTNHYIDTACNYYKNNNAALRIREKNNSNQLTLKVRTEHGNDEYNFTISDSIKKSLIAGDNTYLTTLDIPLFHTNSNIHVVTLQTKREQYEFQDFTFELDENTFGEHKDYELELEHDSLEEAYKKLELLLNHFDIKFQESGPKISRYFKYNFIF